VNAQEEAAANEQRTHTLSTQEVARLVGLLTELQPEASAELCRFVLVDVYGGDMEEAIDTLLHVPLEELRARRNEASQKQLAAAAYERMRAKLSKRRVLARHADVRDHLADGQSVFELCSPRAKPYVAPRHEAVCTPAVRYLDGVVVSRNGERHLVEKAPKWDGGSRGRIVASQRAHHTPRAPPAIAKK
jgi:hypothetical protein